MAEISIQGSFPSLKGSATMRTKSAFAVKYLMAAARFSRMSGEIEMRHAGESLGSFYDEETDYVSSSIILSTASLESNINEYLSDMRHCFPELSEQLQADMFGLLERASILEKYQYALSIKDKEKFDTGAQPYQDANALIRLRNALIHFNPEWHDEQEQHKKLEKLLTGKFQANPFIGGNGVFFPLQCMSYGCAQWAVKSALSFMKRFSEISTLRFRFDQFMDRIKPHVDDESQQPHSERR